MKNNKKRRRPRGARKCKSCVLRTAFAIGQFVLSAGKLLWDVLTS